MYNYACIMHKNMDIINNSEKDEEGEVANTC